MVLKWEQGSGTVLASGDVKVVRLWDVHRESKVVVSWLNGIQWEFTIKLIIVNGL